MMKRYTLYSFLLTILLVACENKQLPVIETGSQTPMPAAWTDKDTGHKLFKLINDEGDNRSFYFHNNPFLTGVAGMNDKMIFYKTVNEQKQLCSVDLVTRETDQITNGKNVSGEIVGKSRREVFYQCGDSVFSTGIENHETKLIYVFPDSIRGRITTINADESLLGGAISSVREREIFRQFPEKRDFFNRVYEAKLKRSLFVINIENGTLELIFSDHAWLNHVQFSSSDPELLMFCHEGPWHKVDRIWTINVNGGQPRIMHRRTMDMEIAGHEFFSRDGSKIWYDLQMPRGQVFYLNGMDMKTGDETRYKLSRDEWSIHFNQSPNQKTFAGDGGNPTQVAKAKDGMWIYLFHPQEDHLKSEKLVNMKHHNYKLEPNVHYSPDGKWIIFRANFEGHSDIYAVEIEK